jgi:hypothetical protein
MLTGVLGDSVVFLAQSSNGVELLLGETAYNEEAVADVEVEVNGVAYVSRDS